MSLLLLIIGTLLSPAAQAQQLPDASILARLTWTTMIALDNANRTQNYSVLRALGSPDFQARNSNTQLAKAFASLRENRVDVGKTINIEPTYHLAPALDAEGHLRLRGGFEFRPHAIRFDILYKSINGGWRIHALSVAQMENSQK